MTDETQEEVSYMKYKQNSMKLLKNFQHNSRYKEKLELPSDFKDNIDRVHIDDITAEQFYERYEKGSKPVILLGLTDKWPAAQGEWSFKRLIERFSNSSFRICDSDQGHPAKLQLGQFIEYVFYNRDDNPYYLFEKDLGAHPEAKEMLGDYKVHSLFDDLFTDMLGE